MASRKLFPPYETLATAEKIRELERLAEPQIEANPYIYGRGMAQLAAAALRGYIEMFDDPMWEQDEFLNKAKKADRQFHLFLAALFDLLCNV